MRLAISPLSLAILGGLWLGSSSAHAASPPSFSLGWSRASGAESCLGARALAQAVEQRLGREVFVATTRATVSIEGRIEKTADGFRAVLALAEEQGQVRGVRELSVQGADCQAINEQLVLVVALLIDPDAALASPRAPAPPAPAPPAAPAAPPAPQGERVHAPEHARPPWRWGASVGTAAGLGMLPGLGGGLLAHGHIEPPSWPEIDLYAASWRSSQAGSQGGPGARASLSYAGLSLCPVSGQMDRLRLQACAGGHLGSLGVIGTNLDENRLAARTLVNLAAQARTRVHVAGPLRLLVGVEAAVPLKRDVFFYRDEAGARQDLFRPSQVVLNVELGVSVIFP